MDNRPAMELLVLRDLDPRHVTRKYARVLEQLGQGDFRSAEVKKLKDLGIYRARLDDKDRLLFKRAEHGGRSYLLILEVVHNHDYAKARFLNGGSYTDADFAPVASPEAEPAERLKYVNPASPTFHVLDKPLSFDAAQSAVIETPLPLIVIGPAGSGKTALTLEKLKTIPGNGLYLTRSSYLVDNARSLYFANGYANEGQEVDFLSLSELLETIEVPRGRQAGYADFGSWYGRMRQLFKLREPHKIYEEINGVLTGAPADGPWMSEEEYLALGVRQSIFLAEERTAVYAVFRRWLEYLRENGLFDANVAAYERRAKAEAGYDFLVIDEVQDITSAELRLALATLKEKRQFLLCGDSNQIVHPNLFSWARIKSLFYGDGRDGDSPLDRLHVLHANYRNSPEVTSIANRLLLLKQQRFGSIDRESNYLVESVGGEPGRAELVKDGPDVRAEIDSKTRRSVHYAVIVLRQEDKDAARAAFTTPLLFTVQEAKGLEYENVVLFDVVGSAEGEFRACAAGVVSTDGGLSYARARDKADKSLEAYKFYVNALYVAMTRAVQSLLIVERDPEHSLWRLLEVRGKSERLEIAASESSREEWQQEARRLELQGKTEQAEQIRREILEASPVPWPVADAGALEGLKARALGATQRDKAAQQLLFEYALTYDAPGLFPELVDAGFRHARNPAGGRAYIGETHYADYRWKSPRELPALIRRHGVDFRNPLNETPLMVAAKLGRAELVRELLAQGADPEQTDTAGRTPLRCALAGFIDGTAAKPEAFAQVYRLLADRPIKTKVGDRMVKLDPGSVEWFLLNLLLVHYRRMIPEGLRQRAHPAFRSETLERLLRSFPAGVLPEHRKQRAYINGVLARNEVQRIGPYNRRLVLRVAHGFYVLNPALDVEVKGSWMGVDELMALPLLLGSQGKDVTGDKFADWRQRARRAWGGPPAADAEPSVEQRKLPF